MVGMRCVVLAHTQVRHFPPLDGAPVKKLVTVLLVLFLVWAIVERPDSLATLMTDGGGKAWDGLTTLFSSVMEFLSSFTS